MSRSLNDDVLVHRYNTWKQMSDPPALRNTISPWCSFIRGAIPRAEEGSRTTDPWPLSRTKTHWNPQNMCSGDLRLHRLAGDCSEGKSRGMFKVMCRMHYQLLRRFFPLFSSPPGGVVVTLVVGYVYQWFIQCGTVTLDIVEDVCAINRVRSVFISLALSGQFKPVPSQDMM